MKMTSTPFSVGLSDDTRVSSRVLRPPGGGHTDIFGSEPEPLRVGRRPGPNATVPAPPKVEAAAEPAAAASAPSQNGNCAPPETPAVTPTETPAPVAPAAPTAPVAEPAKADAPRPAAANPEPPRRVRVPPGGFSSGLW
ncbi:PREDICTED: translation initiation factor IF-2 [Papilio xuthus]|uniref:Translation initiation factor IF-2 n=1 Tax=Papilio xuthus TaxID=66420 RepID=A0AAJ6Z6H7_PAPXU|nr:PREDICTED: translation initiation factor IF-2 [Papilio xuthus]XP_013166283.1 PREDICTED: translation initiation factor IF-2 [Papilio xuthus]